MKSLINCPDCKEPSAVVAMRDGYRVLYCMNKGCGYMRRLKMYGGIRCLGVCGVAPKSIGMIGRHS